MITGLTCIFLPAFASVSTALGADASNEAIVTEHATLIRRILEELERSQAMEFLGEVALWTLAGGLAGLFLAAAAFIAFRSLGWYQSQWNHAKWVRPTAGVLSALVCAVLLGLAGFWHGVIRGSERVFTQSQLATDVFPRVGDAFADGVVWLDELITHGTNITSRADQVKARLNSFRAGEWEWDVPGFLRRLDQFQQESVAELTQRIVQNVLEDYPKLKDSLGELILRPTLAAFVRQVALRQVNEQLQKPGGVVASARERLLAEAARSGNPDTISHRELSQYVVQRGVLPSVLTPLRSIARSQQILMAFLSVSVVVLPALAFRLASDRGATPPAPSAGTGGAGSSP
jgi:hypothetical protein